MKIQDIVFIGVFLTLLMLKRPRVSVLSGIVSLLTAAPLFHFWVFFTAQRLTMYAAAFFALSIVQYMIEVRRG